MASSRSLTVINSGTALSPLREVLIHPPDTREHHRFLLRNLLPEPLSAQASWRYSRKLAQKARASTDGRAVALSMSRCVREVEAATATASPLAVDPMQRVPARFAPRANHPRPDPALTETNDRHRPLAKLDLDFEAAGLEQGAGGGSPRERGAGPRQ